MTHLQLQKYDIFVDKVSIVRERIARLKRQPSIRSLARYTEARLTPRHLIVSAEYSPDDIFEELQLPMREQEALAVVHGVLLALYALHSCNIVHGHLRTDVLRVHRKSGRIVLTEHVLPIDLFVPSTEFGGKVWRCCAPEIKKATLFDYSADIWAVGAVFLQLMAPKGKIFETEDLMELDVLSPDVLSLSASAVSFVVLCLQEEPSSRPTLAELLMHPFLSAQENLESLSPTGDDNVSGSEDGADDDDDDDDGGDEEQQCTEEREDDSNDEEEEEKKS
ncbi:Protein kinase domain [Trypanosoma vivax]|nr:protein kinase [Trypanosoma vivax]KAH8604327.1 Protein kinase domain [Trypanosoma vivax]